MSSASTHSTKEDPSSSSGPTGNLPFELRHGRRYLRDLNYPLPCDLPELQRQNLHTLLATNIFGKPLCCPAVLSQPPRRILEIGCGTGYWSSICHDWLASFGITEVSFTGLDIASLAPDLSKQGIDWRFIQHDLRRIPLPFDDEEFDVVVAKDLSLALSPGQHSQRLLDEMIRVVRKGGIFEVWETDHLIRSLLPHPRRSVGTQAGDDEDHAVATATFPISPGTPFTNAQNRFIQDANSWITEALDRRRFSSTPSVRVAQVLLQEDTLTELEYRRIAIPLGEPRWERDVVGRSNSIAAATTPTTPRHQSSGLYRTASGPLDGGASCLTEEQAALRYTALLVVVQFIESLEPLLKEVSGKNQEEWQRWWALMLADLLENKGASSGECLEIGAWWSRKM